MSEAKDYFFRALRLNPLLWSAYEELCAIGECLDGQLGDDLALVTLEVLQNRN